MKIKMILLFTSMLSFLIITCVSHKLPPQLKMQPTKQSSYVAMNKEQDLYMHYMNDPITGIVISYGPAGTGKTLFACVNAIRKLASGKIKNIILTRPSIAVEGEELGFLPGDLTEKMSPYTQPLFDIFHEFYSKDAVKEMIADGIIEVAPLAFMRGRTFKYSIIIADEMQNSTPQQMKMLTTRIGMNSTLIITGDLEQSDLGHHNGLYDLLNKLNSRKSYTGRIKVVDMSLCKVLRSPVVSEIIDIYNNVEREDQDIEKVTSILTKNHGSIENFGFK
jgi:phosphate starvation-inducible PhoH-like protein